jgi:hypothetical protein
MTHLANHYLFDVETGFVQPLVRLVWMSAQAVLACACAGLCLCCDVLSL